MKRNNDLASVLRRYCADNSILFKDVAEYLKIPRSNVTIWASRFGKMPLKHYHSLLNHPTWKNDLLIQYKQQLLEGAPIDYIPEGEGVTSKNVFMSNGMLPVFSNEYLLRNRSILESVRINEPMLPHRPTIFANIDCLFYVTAPCDCDRIHKGDLLCVSNTPKEYCITIRNDALAIERGECGNDSYGITALLRTL